MTSQDKIFALPDLFAQPVRSIFLESGNLVLALLDGEGALLEWNRALEALAGQAKQGQKLVEFMTEASALRLRKALAGLGTADAWSTLNLNLVSPASDLPATYASHLVALEPGLVLFQAEPVSAVSPAGAEEYLRLTNQLAAQNRELEKAKADLYLRNQELTQAHQWLQEETAKVKLLSGLLPICGYCKKIRNEQNQWEQLEEYIDKRSEATFSHGICPDCLREHYPGFSDDT